MQLKHDVCKGNLYHTGPFQLDDLVLAVYATKNKRIS